ncbi:hypothetical protein [Stenotrophobium rhamnosiphilum]|nr:hypothetical protein [Stenotrophobium rhamnosiphilum]
MKIRRIGYGALLLLLASSRSYAAHSFPISGNVVDANTGVPIANAAVVVQWHARFSSLVDSSTGCLGALSTKTDQHGKFTLPAWVVLNLFISDITATWQAYKSGYLTSTEPLKDSGQIFRMTPLPAAVRAIPNREYYLRYLERSARSIRDCYKYPMNRGDTVDDVYVPFRQLMGGDAKAIAKSPYEDYLAESIKTIFEPGFKSALPPHIDIQKLSPSSDPHARTWYGESAGLEVRGNSSGIAERPQLMLLCAKAVSSESLRGEACDVNMRRANGDTLLMDKVDNDEIVDYLLSHGADPGIRNAWTGNNAMSLLLKKMHIYYMSDDNDPKREADRSKVWAAATHSLELLCADKRTQIPAEIRAELGDPLHWFITEGAPKNFFLRARELTQSLPLAEKIQHLDDDISRADERVPTPNALTLEGPLHMNCAPNCPARGRWEYY